MKSMHNKLLNVIRMLKFLINRIKKKLLYSTFTSLLK